ncbi:hypothetical protein GE061_008910 [Apolygus lucorum]|uniref:Uncharacterized protein n=1 Tax=Apolygus lucorum TaxID=248454 RepID=A0A8S9Y0T6_APOLU|nr:hypothetical protein GE061_008910 [Apolygus lucorum]
MNTFIILMSLVFATSSADYIEGMRALAVASRDLSSSIDTIHNIYLDAFHSVKDLFLRQIPQNINLILNELEKMVTKLYGNTVGRFVGYARKSASREVNQTTHRVSDLLQNTVSAVMKVVRGDIPNFIRAVIGWIKNVIVLMYQGTIEKLFSVAGNETTGMRALHDNSNLAMRLKFPPSWKKANSKPIIWQHAHSSS